jgi:uncharacterized damage-inducible protein DinB
MAKITPLVAIMNYYRDANADVLKKVSDLSDEQLAWRPHPACNSVAFLLWHIARWEDHMQATVPGMTEDLSRRLLPRQQIWERDRLAANWGFNPTQLGELELGTGFDRNVSDEPPWPKKEVLLEYAQQTFAAVEHAISFIDEEQFEEIERSQFDNEYMNETMIQSVTVGNAVMEHLIHTTHHLGEIYYLIGLMKRNRVNRVEG